VVIDVLRATTTISWALKNGADSIQVFADLDLLKESAIKWQAEKRLMLGERGGKKIEGFDLGNSPLSVTKKIVNGEIYILESNFDYLFSIVNGKIDGGIIKNLFTIIRNDDKKIDISFKIPDKVLTGSKYDIDIILNKPLEEVIIAGAIKPYQVNSLFEQEILLEPLASGGIFKITRAPSKPGIQIWSGIIAHPEGMITFTKSIDIVDEI